MNEVKFYFTNYVKEIEIPNITFPMVFKDVMDGTYDNGSFEFICDIKIINQLKKEKFLKEYEFIRREIKVNGKVIDNRLFLINDFSIEKDSMYDENDMCVTINYVESTKLLETYLMPNHTYSIQTIYNNKNYPDEPLLVKRRNSMYDEYYTTYFSSLSGDESKPGLLYERNYRNYISPNKYKTFSVSDELKSIMINIPNKSCTYTDYNFMDITRDKFASLSATPYLDALHREITYISSFGKEKNIKVDGNSDKYTIKTSYNRSTTNNCDSIENKVENVICDYESVWYPNNVELDGIIDLKELSAKLFARPRGLNEGLKEYANWSEWFLELPSNIDTVEKLYAARFNTNDPANNEYYDGTKYVLEDSVYSKLTKTEQAYYAHYKRGDNKIYNICQTLITYEDNVWPWDTATDNNVAFNSMFAIKYKPLIDTDITLIGEDIDSTNKKNIVIDNKSTSDSEIVAQTNYELEKGKFGEYMIEIAGEYQDIQAGDLIEFVNMEKYGIKNGKYLVFKVDNTFDLEGSHQVIFFNEMVAKNNVLMNINNVVRVTQNLSTNQFIKRTYKLSDAIGIDISKSSSLTSKQNVYGDVCSKRKTLYPGCLSRLVGINNWQPTGTATSPEKIVEMYQDTNISALNFQVTYSTYQKDDPSKYYNIESHQYSKQCYTLNSGTISQAICSMIDNVTCDFKGNVVSVTGNLGAKENTFKASVPMLYSDIYGLTGIDKLGFGCLQDNKVISALSHTGSTLYYGNEYPLLNRPKNDYSLIEKRCPIYLQAPNIRKDTRETMQFVYEQTFYSLDKDNVKLSNFFTSTTSAFETMPLYDLQLIENNYLKKINHKDILVFAGKVNNINVLDEKKAIKRIENANDYITMSNGNAFIDISSLGLVGEYTIVLRGVLNRKDMKDGIGGIEPKMIPQFSYHSLFSNDDKYVRISLKVDKIC